MHPVPSRFRASPNVSGIMLSLLAYLLFSAGDATLKLLTPHYPVHQVILINAGLITCFTLLLCVGMKRWGELRTRRPGLHLIRGLVGTSGAFGAVYAFSALPLAEAYTLLFTSPIITVALSSLWLKERFPRAVWGWIGVGFAGVLICLRPGAVGLSLASLGALAAAFSLSLSNLLVRRMEEESSFVLVLGGLIVGIAVTGSLTLFESSPLRLDLLHWNLVAALLSTGAVFSITFAYRLAQASLLGGFQYSQLLWGTLLGYLIWGDRPDLMTLGGASVIVFSGLAVLRLITRKPI
jgi:drug/metabolite transporter (DMT)-like permease